MTPIEILQKVFSDNEPELVLTSYSSHHDADFQLLDCDKYRIGRMICSGVRLLCIGTEAESYSGLEVYDKNTLPERFSWLKGGIAANEDYRFMIMPSSMEGVTEHYSRLPRFEGHPVGFIICESVSFAMEENLGR